MIRYIFIISTQEKLVVLEQLGRREKEASVENREKLGIKKTHPMKSLRINTNVQICECVKIQ